MNWSTTTVVGLETGHRAVDVGELEILKMLLGATRYELLNSDRPVDVSGAVLTPKQWNDLLHFEPNDEARQAVRKALGVLGQGGVGVRLDSSETDRKAALSLASPKRLGRKVSRDEVARASRECWQQRSLIEERERRLREAASPDMPASGAVESIARRRGHITRDLLHELTEALKDG
jgi:hypothetical protein